MIRALFKFAKVVDGSTIIDTTSNSGEYRELSPFVLPAPPAKNLENLWQFSKVYIKHLDDRGEPTHEWYSWRDWGFLQQKAYRYPMGKGSIPAYTYWQGERLGYIDARKKIYAPEYAKNVINTSSFERLRELYASGTDITLLDYDAYEHQKLGMTLIDVINNSNKKMGHAFVLIMLLANVLEECLATVKGVK